MLGVGVGFDTKGANLGINIYSPDRNNKIIHAITDSREGWVDSIGVLLKSYFQQNCPYVEFDYSKLRPEGIPLKIFGGVSAGPKPLINLHQNLNDVLSKYKGKKLNSRLIVDIMNYIGKSVVSGNISIIYIKNQEELQK
jgi:hypothetical protein